MKSKYIVDVFKHVAFIIYSVYLIIEWFGQCC